MNYKKWVFSSVDKDLVSQIADECELDPLIVLIAFSRGMCDPYEIEQFTSLEPDYADPFEYSGMQDAVERINIALESNEKILIFGDYDCDGVTATALLTKYLRSKGADVDYYIPDRENEGYGISVSAIEKAEADGVSLIITVDNGINAVNEAKYAIEQGVDLVITDHHLPQGEIPNAVAVVDPHIDEDCDWLFCDLCGVGIAFKLVCALEGKSCEEMIYEYGDLVTLGTIADVVPLVKENRSIVSTGLKVINRKQSSGIKALIEVSAVKYVTAGNTAFTLCPRINAAGRMSNADIAVKLLLEENLEQALYYAEVLDRLNAERQNIEQDIFDSACNLIEQNGFNKDKIIVVDGYGWHVGVIGIAASKLTEKYGKPCIVISNSNDKSVGSGRSVAGFSLFNAISAVSHTLIKFGGHALAAGITIEADKIETFRKAINNYACEIEMPFPSVKIDCRIKPRALTVDVAKSLKVFEPFGCSNTVPIFAVMESKLTDIQPLSGGKHLRLRLRKENYDYSAVLFGMSADSFAYKTGDIVDIAVTLDINVYNNTEYSSIIIKAIKKSMLNLEEVENQLRIIDKIYNGEISTAEADKVYPKREDMALVYRFLRDNDGITVQKAENELLDFLPVGKIEIAFSALSELLLIEIKNDKISLLKSDHKVQLESAEILSKLKKLKGGE